MVLRKKLGIYGLVGILAIVGINFVINSLDSLYYARREHHLIKELFNRNLALHSLDERENEAIAPKNQYEQRILDQKINSLEKERDSIIFLLEFHDYEEERAKKRALIYGYFIH